MRWGMVVVLVGLAACDSNSNGNGNERSKARKVTVGDKGPDATKTYPPLTNASGIVPLVFRPTDVPRFTGNDAIDDKYTKATLFISNSRPEDLSGDQALAIEQLLTEVVRDAPKHAMAYVNLARIKWYRVTALGAQPGAGELQALDTLLERAERLDSELSEIHVQRGHIELTRRDVLAAEARIARARALEPRSPRPALLAGEVARTNKNYEAMARTGEEALGKARAVRDQSQALTLLIVGYEGLGQIEKADQASQDLLTLHPGSCWSRGNYSLFLSRAQEFPKAIRAAQDALERCDYRAGHIAMANAYNELAELEFRKNGNFKTARQLWEFALEQDPDNPSAHHALGVWWANQFMDDASEASRKKALHHLERRAGMTTGQRNDATERQQARSMAQKISSIREN